MTSLLLFRYVRMQNVPLCVHMCVCVCVCVLLQHLHFPRQINKITGIRLALRYSCVFPDNKSIEHTHAQLCLHTVSQSHTHTHVNKMHFFQKLIFDPTAEDKTNLLPSCSVQ